MNGNSIKHVPFAALAFLLGAVFAMVVAPGDTLLLMGTSIVFGLFGSTLFEQGFGNDWSWPFGRPARRKASTAKSTVGRR